MAETKGPRSPRCSCRTCSLWRMFQKVPTNTEIRCGDGVTIATQWVILQNFPYFTTLKNFEKKKDNFFSLKDFRSQTVDYFLKLYVLGDIDKTCRRKEHLTILCEVIMLGSFLEETVVSKTVFERTVSQYNVYNIIDICRDFPLLPPVYQDFLLRRIAQALSPRYKDFFIRFRYAIETLHLRQKNIVCRICNGKYKTKEPLPQKNAGRLMLLLKAIPTTYTFECLGGNVEIHPPVIQKISGKSKKSTGHLRKIFKNYDKATIYRYLEIVLTKVPFDIAYYRTYPSEQGLALLAGIFMLGYDIGIDVYLTNIWIRVIDEHLILCDSLILYTLIPEKYVYYRQIIRRRVSDHLNHLRKSGSCFRTFLDFHTEISKILTREDIKFCHRMLTSAGNRL